MANSIEMASIDDQILRIPFIEKDEIEEGSKVDHSININQIFYEKFKNVDNSIHESCTIFKVNVWLRESNPDAYTPKMVAIGPYHKKNVQLHPMEKYKWLYLRRFLGRKEGLDAESCIKELEGLKEKALECYDDVETDEFCLMLLLDGCFVVEFIRERREGEDKIINDNIVGYIGRDLLLLENQLPFFVLVKLHDMTKRDNDFALEIQASIILHTFFVEFPATTFGNFLEITGSNIKHLLHLKLMISCHGLPRPMVTSNARELSEAGGCYNINNILNLVCRHLGPAGNGKDNYDNHWYMDMPNATELSEAGVRFEVHHGTSIFDIKFENGSMSIPQFSVTGDTETLLRNLIAYEQQSVDIQSKYFSDFAIFMNNLIESDKDVTLLRQKRIIAMKMGTEKQVANLFNKIASEVPVSPDFYYNEEFRKAVKYCENNSTRALVVQLFLKDSKAKAFYFTFLFSYIAMIFAIMQTILAFPFPRK